MVVKVESTLSRSVNAFYNIEQLKLIFFKGVHNINSIIGFCNSFKLLIKNSISLPLNLVLRALFLALEVGKAGREKGPGDQVSCHKSKWQKLPGRCFRRTTKVAKNLQSNLWLSDATHQKKKASRDL